MITDDNFASSPRKKEQELKIMDHSVDIEQLLPGIDKLWEHTKGDRDIRIAILDGPVNLNHETLKDADITSLDPPENKKIRSAHGTFVSSLIFGQHSGAIKGVAPNCSGMVKSIYYEEQNGQLRSSSQTDIETGIRKALEHGADIINISGGEGLTDGSEIISTLANALQICEEKGVLVVAATGNEGVNKIHIPASYPTVLAVGSINEEGNPSTFSNWEKISTDTGLVTIGENLKGATPEQNSNLAIANGTSFSTALVSGVAGLLASLQKASGKPKNLLDIRKTLLQRVTPCVEEEGINCERIMNGRLNITRALDDILHHHEGQAPSSPVATPQITPSGCSCSSSTDSKTLLTTNNITMENETNVQPSAAFEPQSHSGGEQVSPSSSQEVTPSSAANGSVAIPAATSAVSANSNIQPSEKSIADPGVASVATFNPALNPGIYPDFENSQLVNAIGQPSYDFVTQNNLDLFTAHMKEWYSDLPKVLKDNLTDSPHDHLSMAAFLLYRDEHHQPNALMASQLIWLLNMNSTPVYAISPSLAEFRGNIYYTMELFLADNVGLKVEAYQEFTSNPESSAEWDTMFDDVKGDDDEMRMVLPGYISGQSKLLNRNVIESVTPVAYGLNDWTLNALMTSMKIEDSYKDKLKSILKRLYVNTQNKGQTPDDRALNYSLYNIIELSEIVKEATEEGLQFSNYKIVPSKVSRQHSISREVQLTFFDPGNTNKAATTYAMQVDVSGVTPIIVGEIQKWEAPVSITTVVS